MPSCQSALAFSFLEGSVIVRFEVALSERTRHLMGKEQISRNDAAHFALAARAFVGQTNDVDWNRQMQHRPLKSCRRVVQAMVKTLNHVKVLS